MVRLVRNNSGGRAAAAPFPGHHCSPPPFPTPSFSRIAGCRLAMLVGRGMARTNQPSPRPAAAAAIAGLGLATPHLLTPFHPTSHLPPTHTLSSPLGAWRGPIQGLAWADPGPGAGRPGAWCGPTRGLAQARLAHGPAALAFPLSTLVCKQGRW
jgi:hypothetical protein